MSEKQPKYAFGLLQTPSDTENVQFIASRSTSSTVSAYPSNSSSCVGKAKKGSNSTVCTPILPNSSSMKHYSIKQSTSGRSMPATPASCGSVKIRTPRHGTSTTPYTASSSMSNDVSCSTLVAVVEGRGLARGEIGMTSLDLKQPVLCLSQLSDSQTYTKTLAKLQHIHPLEIILPNTLCEAGNNNKLLCLITNQFPNVTISSVQRRYFNESKGLHYVRHLSSSDYKSIELQISNKYYCLATTAALLKYIEFVQNVVFSPNSLKVVFRGCEHTTMIDFTSVKNLELLQNLKDPMSQHTLYGILNYTRTAGGARLLRSNILQPPNDEETIQQRHDAVSELTEKEEMFYNIQSILSRFTDIGHIVSVCIQIPKQETVRTAESKLNCVIMLKHTLQLVEPLKESLSYYETTLLKLYCKALSDPRFEVILGKIGEVISDDTHYQKGLLQQRYQKCSAVKFHLQPVFCSTAKSLLDVARRTYSELVDDMEEYIHQLGETNQLPLRATYSSLRGFHIQMPVNMDGKNKSSSGGSNQDDLPSVFIKVTKYRSTLSFTTMDLIQLNERIKSSLDEIYLMANIVVTELLASINEHISCLYELADKVAMVDLLVSFAHAASLYSYIRPEFTDTLAIKQGYHPILQTISSENIVPNDTYASENSNFVLLTGPNMGGKSTYLRQVSLLQIMAQMGSFVPAQFASFRVADQLFSRIGSDDDMESNSSTFTLEMKETNYILQNITDKSLIIIDELGRGTSAEEGVGICWAISEVLLKKKAFTFFVTHYRQLTDLGRNHPNVANYFCEVQRTFNPDAKCEKVSYTHVLARGVTPETHYGLKLAAMSTMPQHVIEDAQQITAAIDKRKQKNITTDREFLQNNAKFTLATKLIQVAKNSRMDEGSLKIYLKSLRSAYESDMSSALGVMEPTSFLIEP